MLFVGFGWNHYLNKVFPFSQHRSLSGGFLFIINCVATRHYAAGQESGFARPCAFQTERIKKLLLLISFCFNGINCIYPNGKNKTNCSRAERWFVKMLLAEERGLGDRWETQCHNSLAGFGVRTVTAVAFAIPANGSSPCPPPMAPSRVGGRIFLELKRNWE